MKLSDWIDRQPVRVGFGRGGAGAIVDGSGGNEGLPPPPSPIVQPDFSSRADVETAIIEAEIPFVRTAGYYEPGDQGGGLYVRRTVEPVHNLKIQSADGAFWELVIEQGRITEKQAGGIGDGVADDTQAIQDAINFVLYHDGTSTGAISSEIFIVGPYCRLTDTIHLGYGDLFHGVVVKGVARKRRAQNENVGTALIADFNDRPIISIQGARATTISDLWIDGAINFGTLDYDGYDVTKEETWDALGGNGRYNPYAAIAIDAYSGVRPAQSYPDVNYPDFLQPIGQYGKFFSSDIRIQNVGIRYVNTAVVVQPSDVDGNGDFVKITDCDFEFVKYGVSIGNAQSRNVEVRNLVSGRCFTVFANNIHGKQRGRFGGPITNASLYAFIGRIFSFDSTSNVGSASFSNLYAEELHRIGDFSDNPSSEGSLEFENCQFKFRHSEARSIPANLTSGPNRSELVFRGCRFEGAPSVYAFDGMNFQFQNCRTDVTERSVGTIPRYEAFAHNATSGGLITNALDLQPQGVAFRFYNLDTGTSTDAQLPREGLFKDTTRETCVPLSVFSFGRFSELYGQPVRKRFFYFERQLQTHFSSVTLNGRTLTLEFITHSDQQAMIHGGLPGDVIRHIDTGMVFFIRSRSRNTVIAEAQNNYISDGAGGVVPIAPFSTSSGRLQFMNCRVYTPNYTTVADFTNGSAVATSAGRPDGYAGYMAAEIIPGDYFYSQNDQDGVLTLSTAMVSAVDETAKTITFAGNARETIQSKVLDQFVRTPPPNE